MGCRVLPREQEEGVSRTARAELHDVGDDITRASPLSLSLILSLLYCWRPSKLERQEFSGFKLV